MEKFQPETIQDSSCLPMDFTNKVILSANVQQRDHYYNFSKHIHSDIEIYHILAGECKMDICQEVVSCKKNDLIMILPNTVHSFYLDCEAPCTFEHIHFNPAYLKKLYFDGISILCCMTSAYHFYGKISSDASCRALISAILENNDNSNPFSNAKGTLSLIELLLILFKKSNPAKQISSESAVQNHYVSFAIDYIKKNYATKILISDIADPLGISSRYLSKIFSQHTNLTILNYINIFRINKSIEMMTNTDLPLSEIAVQIGCAGSQHFSKLFRNIIGLNPHKYKDLLKNQS